MSRKNKVDIPDDLKTKCNVIIHGASTASAAACAGIAQIPLADNAVLAPIQIAMIVSVAKVFEHRRGCCTRLVEHLCSYICGTWCDAGTVWLGALYGKCAK